MPGMQINILSFIKGTLPRGILRVCSTQGKGARSGSGLFPKRHLQTNDATEGRVTLYTLLSSI